MSDLDQRRTFFAEELEAVVALSTPALVEAFATVPRERFLPPGPWTVQGEFLTAPRRTPDGDPRHVYHNVALGIDPSRMLFNGQPGTIGRWMDALALAPGARVLHVGCGTGYYTAVMARCVGSSGRVHAIEADEGLAATASANLGSTSWIDVRAGTAAEPLGERFDAVLINAGVTHPLDVWLDALAPGGRMVFPLTVTTTATDTIGRGLSVHVARDEQDPGLAARLLMPVAIYSAVGVRDSGMNERLREAFTRNPFPSLKRLRRDAHETSADCWVHGTGFCLSTT
jgi:protein-L-isoaspartate(D-aspartate) O-methyltransferase